MQTSLRASLQGKEMVKQARRDAKWARNDPRWLLKVSIELDPDPKSRERYKNHLNLDIQTLEAQISQIACVSLSTWERFLQGKSINGEAFKACCHALGLPWQAISELDLVKLDYDAGREANKLNNAFDLAFNQGNYLKAKKVLADIVPSLRKVTKFSASDSVIDRLDAAILIAEFLISKQVDILDLNLMLGDMKSSLGYCQDALRHYESVFYEAPEGKYKLLAALNSGAVCLNTCQYQKALSFLEKVSSIQAPELAVQANYLRGWIAMYQGNFHNAANLLRPNIYKAETEVKKSIDIWESMAYTKGIGDARFALGKIYNQSANYRDAIKEYETAYATYSGMEYSYKSIVALRALENIKN